MKNIVVAGACGFLGSSLIKRMLHEEVRIWAIDSFFRSDVIPETDKIIRVNSTFELADIDNYFSCPHIDAFYNFAWCGVNGKDKANYSVQLDNIKIMLKYAELAHALHSKKYLCAGTIAERATESIQTLHTVPGGMMYSSAKRCARLMTETFCKNNGQQYVWMQFSNIYGPTNKTGNLISYTIEQLRKSQPASFGPALQPYDFLYVDDLVEAVYRLGVLDTSKSFYYIGTGKPRILKDYLVSIGEIYGRPDLIHIGERADDGIRYSYEMLDCTGTISEIGDYVSDTFENHVRYTINNY